MTLLESVIIEIFQVLHNAVEQGIEEAHVRESKQKPAYGKISLRYSSGVEQGYLTISDDGSGINLESM